MFEVWDFDDRYLIPEMNTSKKAMDCFSIVNLMLGYLLSKKF